MESVRAVPKKHLLSGLLILIFALLVALPLYAPRYTLVQLSDIFMYIVATVSWVLFSGPTRYISLATAAFLGIGVYTSALLGFALPLPAVIAIGGFTAFCLALLVGALTLRLRGIYFAMFTFGLTGLMRDLVLWWEVNISRTVGRLVKPIDHSTVYYVMLGILVVLLVVSYFLKRSKYGLALQSIGESEEAAAHTGINVTALKVITFAISAFFMGASGAIMATRWTYIDPRIAFNPYYSFMPVLMAIFGGTEQLYGPILGAAVFTYLEEVLITRFPYYYMLLFGAILLVVVLFLPGGFVGLIQERRKGGLVRKRANT